MELSGEQIVAQYPDEAERLRFVLSKAQAAEFDGNTAAALSYYRFAAGIIAGTPTMNLDGRRIEYTDMINGKIADLHQQEARASGVRSSRLERQPVTGCGGACEC